MVQGLTSMLRRLRRLPRPCITHRRAPSIESLQRRVLLSVDPALAGRLEAAGYEKITWKGHETYAAPGQWVASFRNVYGSREHQVATAAARLGKAAPRAGLRVERQLGRDGLFRVDAPVGKKFKDVRSALGRVKGFDFVEPNFAVWAQDLIQTQETVAAAPPGAAPQSIPPTDDRYVNQYGLHNTGQTSGVIDADIDAPEAWALAGGGGEDVVVGVIDTGVDYTHPDLAASMWVNAGEIPGDGIDNDDNGFIDDVHGYDFADLDGDPMDDQNHGTHVAGILAAANNGTGTVGIAFGAKIMALRFLAADGFGGINFAIEALNYAMLMKSRGVNIRVTNNSWGGAEFSEAMDQAIRRSADAGMLFVAAAGNGDAEKRIGYDIDDASGPGFYPAGHDAPSILSVAATDNYDRLTSFSNFGAAGVDLAAPGFNVVSTVRGGQYTWYSGTSMATALVSGVAALAFSMNPDATWQQVRDAIVRGVDPLAALSGKMVTGGRLNAHAALRRMQAPEVVARQVFYNNSRFDGRTAAADERDDRALAADKAALLPGAGPATFANYTSYPKGINGVMVDVRNLPTGELTADDFSFNLGTESDLLASWEPAPTPTNVTVRRGAGAGGADRVTLTFPDNTIRNTWLRVTVLANERTGLASPDVFYFGNAVGETGNTADNALVNAIDYSALRSRLFTRNADLSNPYDLDRDGRISALDLVIVRRSRTAPQLPLITLPEL